MARDRQIFVRTTQEAYDWVVTQAEATGLSHGALVSELLEMAARSGWVLERQIAVAGQPSQDPVAALRRQTGTRQPPVAKPEQHRRPEPEPPPPPPPAPRGRAPGGRQEAEGASEIAAFFGRKGQS